MSRTLKKRNVGAMLGCLLLGLVLFCISWWAINTRYDPFCGERCSIRWTCFFEPGFLKSLESGEKEEQFRVFDMLTGLEEQAPSVALSEEAGGVISYALYGTEDKYFRNLIPNAKRIHERLAGWTVRLYLHDGLERERPEFIESLKEHGVEIKLVKDAHVRPGNSAGAFWRMLPLWEDVDCVILDADDILTEEDVDAIGTFFSSPNRESCLLETSNISPWPLNSVQAGLIYKKRELKLDKRLESLARCYPHRSSFGMDEVYLCIYVFADVHPRIWRHRTHSSAPVELFFRRLVVAPTVAERDPELLAPLPTT
jgi:hypothetical protein